MESKLLIFIITVFSIAAVVCGFLIYKLYESKKCFEDKLSSINERYNEREKTLKSEFMNINKQLKTIPNVNQKIDNEVNTLVNAQKNSLEKYVLNSFKKVDSDLVFTSVIDNCKTKTVSLKKILENKKDTIEDKFQNLIGNMGTINTISINATNNIKQYKDEINTEFKKLQVEVEKYNSYYKNGQQLKKDFERRIANLENLITDENGDSQGSKSSLSSQTDTFDDMSFTFENSEVNYTAELNDEPMDDESYVKRYK